LRIRRDGLRQRRRLEAQQAAACDNSRDECSAHRIELYIFVIFVSERGRAPLPQPALAISTRRKIPERERERLAAMNRLAALDFRIDRSNEQINFC
jgi:hypothetical protein